MNTIVYTLRNIFGILFGLLVVSSFLTALRVDIFALLTGVSGCVYLLAQEWALRREGKRMGMRVLLLVLCVSVLLLITPWYFLSLVGIIPLYLLLERTAAKQALPYVFLFLLILLAIEQYHAFLGVTKWYVVPLAIFAGVLTFWFNREKIETSMEEEKTLEEEKEEQRKKAFPDKFPTLNKIWGIRTIAKWMYKEGWWSVALIFLFVLFFLFLSHNLGERNFFNDEFPVIDSAKNHMETGNFYKWDWIRDRSGEKTDCYLDEWCHYTRAEIHTLLVSASFRFFGESETSARLVSLLFGLLFFFTTIILSGFLGMEKRKRFLLLTMVITSPFFLYFFRYTRMYALLIPLFLLVILLTLKFLTSHGKKRKIYLLFFPLLVLLIFHLHSISLLLLVTILMAFLIEYFSRRYGKKRSHICFSLLLAFFIAVFFFSFFLGNYLSNFYGAFDFFSLRSFPAWEYVKMISSHPLGFSSGLVFLSLGIVLVSKEKIKKNYFYLITVIPIILIIFFLNRFPHQVYISPFIIAGFVIITDSFYAFLQTINKKMKKIIFFLFVIFCLVNFSLQIPVIYGSEDKYYADYGGVYDIIKEKYDPQKDVIFLQYTRNYYLDDLDYRGGKIYHFGRKNYSKESFDAFLNNLNESHSGFITWEKSTEGDINGKIVNYVKKRFIKLVDAEESGSNIELYYFNGSMTQ